MANIRSKLIYLYNSKVNVLKNYISNSKEANNCHQKDITEMVSKHNGMETTGENCSIFEKNKKNANLSTVADTNKAKCSKSELQLSEKSTKHNSRNEIESEEEKNDTENTVNKCLFESKIPPLRANFLSKIPKNDNLRNIRTKEKMMAVKNKELELKVYPLKKCYDLSNPSIFHPKSNVSRNLEEIVLENKKKLRTHSKPDKLLSCLYKDFGGQSKSFFLCYKNAEKTANKTYGGGFVDDEPQLYVIKGEQSEDKVGFLYKKQASSKVNFHDVENKKQKLLKIPTNPFIVKSIPIHFEIKKHNNLLAMSAHLKKKEKHSEMKKQVYESHRNFHQFSKKVNARYISIVENQKSKSTSSERSTHLVEKKNRYHFTNQLSHGDKFGATWEKIKITKPEFPKREVMTKEKRNSLERFNIFYNRIAQENIRQYKYHHTDKLKYGTKPSDKILFVQLNHKKK